MLEHKKIPPNIHIRKLNPNSMYLNAFLSTDTKDFFDSTVSARGINVPLEAVPWPADRLERISVNSFGAGGSNAHVGCLAGVLIESIRADPPFRSFWTRLIHCRRRSRVPYMLIVSSCHTPSSRSAQHLRSR